MNKKLTKLNSAKLRRDIDDPPAIFTARLSLVLSKESEDGTDTVFSE